MGEWVYRDKDNHTCDKPGYEAGVKAGDIWRCGCGKLWKVKSVGYDQRDNDSWINWEEYSGAIPEQQRGGTVKPHRMRGDSSGIYEQGSR